MDIGAVVLSVVGAGAIVVGVMVLKRQNHHSRPKKKKKVEQLPSATETIEGAALIGIVKETHDWFEDSGD